LKNNVDIDPVVGEMLLVIEKVFKSLDINFYVVGAIARDLQLAKRPQSVSLRKTNDVDLAIMVGTEEDFYIIKETLLNTGYFKGHSSEPIKLFYKEAIELDLLPFGGIQNTEYETTLHKPKLFVMDMPGFKEALQHTDEIIIDEKLKLKVCSLEGLVILKLFAFANKPDRTKDIIDIDHIISAYFELCSDDIYDSYMDVMEMYDTVNPHYLSLISAHVIGRKIKVILSSDTWLINRLADALAKRPTPDWAALLRGLAE
jgi:predicted nucleotidyltransferase